MPTMEYADGHFELSEATNRIWTIAVKLFMAFEHSGTRVIKSESSQFSTVLAIGPSESQARLLPDR